MPIEVVPTYYGIRTTAWDPLTTAEEIVWVSRLRSLIPTLDTFYGQLVDLRGRRLDGLTNVDLVQEAMELVLAHGLQRSAVIVADSAVAMLTKRVALEMGVYACERYIDASAEPGWERLALEWLDHGLDPDLL